MNNGLIFLFGSLQLLLPLREVSMVWTQGWFRPVCLGIGIGGDPLCWAILAPNAWAIPPWGSQGGGGGGGYAHLKNFSSLFKSPHLELPNPIYLGNTYGHNGQHHVGVRWSVGVAATSIPTVRYARKMKWRFATIFFLHTCWDVVEKQASEVRIY